MERGRGKERERKREGHGEKEREKRMTEMGRGKKERQTDRQTDRDRHTETDTERISRIQLPSLIFILCHLSTTTKLVNSLARLENTGLFAKVYTYYIHCLSV